MVFKNTTILKFASSPKKYQSDGYRYKTVRFRQRSAKSAEFENQLKSNWFFTTFRRFRDDCIKCKIDVNWDFSYVVCTVRNRSFRVVFANQVCVTFFSLIDFPLRSQPYNVRRGGLFCFVLGPMCCACELHQTRDRPGWSWNPICPENKRHKHSFGTNLKRHVIFTMLYGDKCEFTTHRYARNAVMNYFDNVCT